MTRPRTRSIMLRFTDGGAAEVVVSHPMIGRLTLRYDRHHTPSLDRLHGLFGETLRGVELEPVDTPTKDAA